MSWRRDSTATVTKRRTRFVTDLGEDNIGASFGVPLSNTISKRYGQVDAGRERMNTYIEDITEIFPKRPIKATGEKEELKKTDDGVFSYVSSSF